MWYLNRGGKGMDMNVEDAWAQGKLPLQFTLLPILSMILYNYLFTIVVVANIWLV